MTGVLVVAAGFATVIAVGTTAVALNDALERWWAARGTDPRYRGGRERRATAPGRRGAARTAGAAVRPTIVSAWRVAPPVVQRAGGRPGEGSR